MPVERLERDEYFRLIDQVAIDRVTELMELTEKKQNSKSEIRRTETAKLYKAQSFTNEKLYLRMQKRKVKLFGSGRSEWKK